MRCFGLTVLFTIFICQFASASIDVEKVIIDHNQKIKRLTLENKMLMGKIELLEHQQKSSNTKIEQVFKLIEYRSSNAKIHKTTLKLQQRDEQAKKKYLNSRNLLATGQYNEAVQSFKYYLKTYPDDSNVANANYWLARSYLAKEDYHNAKETFELFQQQNPSHYKFSNTLFELAKVYINFKQNDKAVKLLSIMLIKFPTHSAVYKAKQLLTKISPLTATKINNLSIDKSN